MGFSPLGLAEDQKISGKKSEPKKLAPLFFRDERNQLLLPGRKRTSEVRAAIKSSRVEHGCVPVISSERLSGHPMAGRFDYAVICERITDALPNARILLVIREQASLIYSTYNQFIRIGGTMSLVDFIDRQYDGRAPFFSRDAFRFDLIIDTYMQSFGQNNVLVLPYELLCLDHRAFCKKIFSFVGRKEIFRAGMEVRVNVYEKNMVAHKLRFLNLLTTATSVNGYSWLASQSGGKLIRGLRRLLGNACSLVRSEAYNAEQLKTIYERIETYYTESNKKTEALTGLNLREMYKYS